MLCRGESLGVFQVESRAQMNMLPRLKPRTFYDLVIEVAIVRPGPIQGDMVHPYLRRRNGKEKENYPSPSPEHGDKDELYKVLHKTLGVPLFQEQAMRIAIEAAKFTPEEANGLRRAMATFRNVGTIGKFENKMIGNMIARGYDAEFARNCFEQIKGFGSYGFPESHAASFAQLVYVSSWLKHYHPDAFCCGLLNSQPMGFYAPAQIVGDARKNRVEVRAIDVSYSFAQNTLERGDGKYCAVRLGFRQIDGFRWTDPDEARLQSPSPFRDAPPGADPESRDCGFVADATPRNDGGDDWAERIVAARIRRPFTSLEDFARDTGLPKRALILLADADAFRSIGLDRRAALWAVRRLPDDVPLPLFEIAAAREQPDENVRPLPLMPLPEQVVADYQTIRLSLKGHPMQFLRPMFARERVVACKDVCHDNDGRRLRCAGVVLVRQRPGSAKGVVFMTIEDETGIANIVVWPKVMERFRKEVMGARLILVEGYIQSSPEQVTHLVAQRLFDRSHDLIGLAHDAMARKHAVPAGPALIEPLNDDRREHPDHPAQKIRHPRHRAHAAALTGFSLGSKICPGLFRRRTDRRSARRPVQEGDRRERAKPRADCRKHDIDPVFGIADHGVGREQIPHAAPGGRRHPPARDHRRGKHDIDRIRRGGRQHDASGGQWIDGSHCNSFHAEAELWTLSRFRAKRARFAPGKCGQTDDFGQQRGIMQSPREILTAIWTAAAGEPSALESVTLTGDEPLLPSSFRVAAAAQAGIAAAGLAAAQIWQSRSRQSQQVTVDMAHAVVECRSERYLRVDGKPPGPTWDAIAGIYQTRDRRFVRLHTNFRHHRDAVCRVLNCEPEREAVAGRADAVGRRAVRDRRLCRRRGGCDDAPASGMVGIAARQGAGRAACAFNREDR